MRVGRCPSFVICLEDALVGKYRNFLTLAAFSLAVAVMASPESAAAQRRTNPNLKKVLVVPPVPATPQDSAYTLEFADEVRKRLAGRVRNQMRVYETDEYCEALEASGFDCGTLLDANSAEQLARFMSADAYVTGTLEHSGSVPTVHVRMSDIGRSGLAGVMDIAGEQGQEAKDFANAVGDSLRNQVRAAEFVRDCGDRRDRGDLRGARERADRAFELYPNHPAAALCTSYVFEVTEQPADSLIWAYQRCVAGDPMEDRCWDRMARMHFAEGDTVAAIEAFEGQLRANEYNEDLRVQVAQMWIEVDEVDRAVSMYDRAVELGVNPDRFLQLKAARCAEAEQWACTLAAYEGRYELDQSLASDTMFMQGVIGAADFAGDTAASIRWTGIAVSSFAGESSFRLSHAAWLKDAGMTDSALAVFRSVVAAEPDNTPAQLAIVTILQDGLVVDSTVPLDTATMARVDSILTGVVARSGSDDATLSNVGALYLRTGMQLANLRGFEPRITAEWLAKALELPIAGSLRERANFFLGFTTIFYLPELFAEVQEAKTCEAVDMYEFHVLRGKEALTAGRSLSAQSADALLQQQYPPYEDVIGQFRAAYECTEDR